jgi:predicted 3-demethylubiquinone-9 3-methyltransferase (glyoxalase superfamily)
VESIRFKEELYNKGEKYLMATKIRTHLMFDGTAGDAMNFYVGLFPMSEVIDVSYYNEGEIDILPALKDGDSFVFQVRELCYQQS